MKKVELDNVPDCYQFVADKISENVEKRYCVVHKNIAEYDGYISSIFKKNSISFDRNYNFSLSSDSFCTFVVSLLRVIKFDFDIYFFVDFLEIIPYISNEELGVLRNYLTTYSVKDLTKEFDIRSFIDKREDEELNVSRIKWLNNIRERCIDLINEIKRFVQIGKLYNLIFFLSKKFEYDKSENFNFYDKILHGIGDTCTNIDYFLRKFLDKISNVKVHIGDRNLELFDKLDMTFSGFDTIFFILEDISEYNNKFESFNDNAIFLYSKRKIKFSENFFSKKKKYFKRDGVFSKKITGKYKDLGTNLLKINVSQIEKYYLCPFSYFCSNILKLREVKAFEFDNKEYGLLMHHVLERGMRKYIESNKLAKSYDIVLEYLSNRFSKVYHQNMIVSISRNISTKLDMFLKSIIEMREKENLKTIFLEKKIHKKIDCDGIKISITGIVDRVDIKDEQIIVIDYKTSEKKFDLNNFLYGFGSQIVIYLDMLNLNNYNEYGAIYISYKNNEIYDEQSSDITKNLKISGVSLDLHSGVKNINGVDMNLILKYSSFLLDNTVNNILNFEFKKCVTCINKKNSCNDCKYRDICYNFDVIYQNVKKNDLPNIYEWMKKKCLI